MVRLCERSRPPISAILLEPLTLDLEVDYAPLLPLLERPRPYDDRSLGKLGRGIFVEEVLVPDGLEKVVEHKRGGWHQLGFFVARVMGEVCVLRHISILDSTEGGQM